MSKVNGLFLKDYFSQIWDGYWINEEKLGQIEVERVVYTKPEMVSKNNAFIAMTKKTFLEGSKNQVYTKWSDSHEHIIKDIDRVSLLIVERAIPNVAVPQYVVDNSYEFMTALGKANRERFSGKIISVTGTVGKTNVVELLSKALKTKYKILAPKTNYNSRTAIRCMLASLLPGFEYDFVVLEVALSALWYGDTGITEEIKSDYAILTQFGRGQNGTSVLDAIKFKSRLTKNMSSDKIVILNQDVEDFSIANNYILENTKNIFSYSMNANDAWGYYLNRSTFKDKSIVCFRVNDRDYKFYLNLQDSHNEGCLSNLLSVLVLLALINEDLKDYQETFLSFEKRPHFLEEIQMNLENKLVTIVDDTYNAEELSMMNAFSYMEKISSRFKGKKIAILGDIINLNNQKETVYEKIADKLNHGLFDEICTFGENSELIIQKLRSSIEGKHFTNVGELKNYVAKKVTPDSAILVKGSVNGTQMRKVIPHLLKENVTVSQSKSSRSVFWGNDESCIGNSKLSVEYGVGNLLIIHEVLFRLQEKIITLRDAVSFSKNVLELNSARSTNAVENEKRYLEDVLSQAASLNAPDAILALARFLYNDNATAVRELKRKAEKARINLSSVANVTGRINRKLGQQMTINDLKKAANLFVEINKDYLRLIKNRNWLIHEKYFPCVNPLDQRLSETASIFWGSDNNLGVVFDFSKDKVKSIVGMSTGSHENIKSQLYYLLENVDFSPIVKKQIRLNTGKINILGDVYFGEWYSEKRKRNNQSDALMKKGYHHSFENISKKLKEEDLNIANFEAIFPCPKISGSPVEGIKPFNLYADSDRTLAELKNRNIHMVSLATNHTFDFGKKSIDYSLDCFEHSNIETIGAGKNQSDAYSIVEAVHKKRTVAIFNGYWYRIINEKKFNGYAYNRQSGVGGLTSLLVEKIKAYKQQNQENKILVICHWGVDFHEIHPKQREIADQLTAAGADLILGHGPHFIQPIETINHKNVLFSVGNGVFNSDGEFDARKIPPYGLFTQLDLLKEEIRLYPMYIHNKKTFWQPHFIKEDQIVEFKSLDLGICNKQKLEIDSDKNYYLAIPWK